MTITSQIREYLRTATGPVGAREIRESLPGQVDSKAVHTMLHFMVERGEVEKIAGEDGRPAYVFDRDYKPKRAFPGSSVTGDPPDVELSTTAVPTPTPQAAEPPPASTDVPAHVHRKPRRKRAIAPEVAKPRAKPAARKVTRRRRAPSVAIATTNPVRRVLAQILLSSRTLDRQLLQTMSSALPNCAQVHA